MEINIKEMSNTITFAFELTDLQKNQNKENSLN